MEIIMLIGGGFVLGMYFTTQISEWIEGRNTNKDLIENMEKLEKKSK
jgi:hypothetical protein